ncbi:hypothetical protein [Spiroplasma sp. BIUS-1]|uniref:hypothetical protein n=1 Tax=Spiroplasma sp. BIUS-1 TaxID=216964 RepID=UPI0013A6EAE3|nr:hypothetical protein [Spiroplasma sp. BIUS-1]
MDLVLIKMLKVILSFQTRKSNAHVNTGTEINTDKVIESANAIDSPDIVKNLGQSIFI